MAPMMRDPIVGAQAAGAGIAGMARRFVLIKQQSQSCGAGHAAVLASPPQPTRILPGPQPAQRGPMVIVRRQASPQQDRENDLQCVDDVLQHVAHLLLAKGIAYGNKVADGYAPCKNRHYS
jgi:hypothetical protein